jgi:AcrR family transcriptional regulator
MSTPVKKRSTAPRGNRKSRGDQRRTLIFKSLHDCIIDRGYPKTTLADIAAGADMSASHLLYYFKGKEAMLEHYFENVAVSFVERIDGFGDQPPAQQINLLADFWFKSSAGAKSEIGFMLECFGVAVNDEVLRVTKAGFDARCKAYLISIFENTPAAFMNSSKDAAEIAYALMIGLRSAVYFDDDIDLKDAHRLFHASMTTMCGLD